MAAKPGARPSALGITGLVLAGGRSSRMGGLDKALLDIHGKPMAAWVIERFLSQVQTLIVNANSSEATYTALGYPLVADSLAGHPGPLAGILAGCNCATTPLVAWVPCDAPLLPMDLVAQLRVVLDETKADIAVARTAAGLQPTFALCRRTIAPSIADFLASGGRALHQWLSSQNRIEVDFTDEVPFSNVNTPEDLGRVATLLSSQNS